MNDEPVNKLYGNKVKLDFTKLGKNPAKESSTTVEVKKENLKSQPDIKPPVEEEGNEKIVEEVVKEPVEKVEDAPKSKDEVKDEPVEKVEDAPKSKDDDPSVSQLKKE